MRTQTENITAFISRSLDLKLVNDGRAIKFFTKSSVAGSVLSPEFPEQEVAVTTRFSRQRKNTFSLRDTLTLSEETRRQLLLNIAAVS